MSKILEMRSKRNKLWEDAKNYLETHRGAEGLLSAENVAEYDKMVNEVKALGDEIKRLEEQADIDNILNAPTTTPVQHTPQALKTPEKYTASKEYSDAFWAVMRGKTSPEYLNVLTTGTGEGSGGGGYTIPDEFHTKLIEALSENNFIRKLATVIKTNNGLYSIPIAADIGEASWIEEGAPITEGNVSFSQKSLSAYKMGKTIRVTNELLNDSAFNIANHIATRFGASFALTEEKAFLIGKGKSNNPTQIPSEPTGILTSIQTAGATTQDSATITFDDVYSLYYALKAPYRRKASFFANETTVLKLMTLKDKNDCYLFKPSLEIGKPDTLLGHPLYTSTFMPSFTATPANDVGKKILLFGDISYYYIGDRQNRTLKRLNEYYAINDQTGFVCTQRVDGVLTLDEAVQCLKLGAAPKG